MNRLWAVNGHGLSALKMWRTVWCAVYDVIKSKEYQSSTAKVSKSSTLLLVRFCRICLFKKAFQKRHMHFRTCLQSSEVTLPFYRTDSVFLFFRCKRTWMDGRHQSEWRWMPYPEQNAWNLASPNSQDSFFSHFSLFPYQHNRGTMAATTFGRKRFCLRASFFEILGIGYVHNVRIKLMIAPRPARSLPVPV